MLNTCPLNTGVYTIIAKTGPVGAGYCGNRVVVNKPSDFFMVRNQRGPDDCTYSLYTLDKKQVFSESGNVVIENNDIVNEWVITALGGNIYTIARTDRVRAWTDPEGPPSCEHQLHLTELTGYITDQQKFRILHA